MFDIEQKGFKPVGGELPDISKTLKTAMVSTLNKVGMAKMQMPVKFGGARVPASVDAFVSLDEPHAKGIHMSRLYVELRNMFEAAELGWPLLRETLKKFLNTHHELSQKSFLRVELNLPVERKALVSEESGWRQYPVVMEGRLENGQYHFAMEVKVLYSSTCPCSAALARQLVSQNFLKDFASAKALTPEEVAEWLEKESSIVAVPHAQRSEAHLKVKFAATVGDVSTLPEPLAVIDKLEKVLGTPVQAAVKRADEQEFARLNGTHLMFCEDAARKLKMCAEAEPLFADYWIRVAHQESLHPHDAVAVVVKGVPGGFSDEA